MGRRQDRGLIKCIFLGISTKREGFREEVDFELDFGGMFRNKVGVETCGYPKQAIILYFSN